VFNCVAILLLGLPVILGFNVLSFITPLGEGTVILDLYDFILSQNILQIGAIIYVFYVTWKYGWGFDKYLAEANLGSGFKMTRKFQFYFKYVLPLIIVLLLIQGYIGIFGK
jgi:NSS family neurotransmitter:Na+ symporter